MTPEQTVNGWVDQELKNVYPSSVKDLIRWWGFVALPYHIMGSTYEMLDNNGVRAARIYLNDLWVDHPGILRDAVLWHETAHALNWVIDGGSGHGVAWLKRVWSRPGYAILDYVASFAFAYWSYRHERVRDRRHAPLDGQPHGHGRYDRGGVLSSAPRL